MLLTPQDERLVHTAPTPAVAPATSDPRLNDGYYFGVFTDEVYIFFGMRFHPNSNVADGFAGIRVDGVQHNLRMSRALWPDREHPGVGPLWIDVVEPFRELRATLGVNPLSLEFDLTLTSALPPIEEAVHTQSRGRAVLNEVLRYTQVGDATGSATFEGRELDLGRASFCRDHSWGIRAAMGSRIDIQPDPDADTSGDLRQERLWLPFALKSRWGFVQAHWDGDGELLDLEGVVVSTAGGLDAAVTSCRRRFDYDEESGAFRQGELVIGTTEGDHTLRLSSTGVAVNPQGFGYRRGWSDGRQPGVPRGRDHVEHDRYDVRATGYRANPAHVPQDKRMGPVEYIVRVDLDGETGLAQMEHPRYG